MQADAPQTPPSERRAAVASLVRRARARLALTDAQLAELVGVTRETIVHWEAGRKLPKPGRIRTPGGEAGPLAVALELDWKRLAKARARDADRRRQARLLGVHAGTLLAAAIALVWQVDAISDALGRFLCLGAC